MPRIVLLWLLLVSSIAVAQPAERHSDDPAPPERPGFGEQIVDSPFVELYVLEELKQLRIDLAAQKHEMTQQIVDRELHSVDRGVEYATDVVTYFFYLIAAASSLLVLIGWTSVRDMKERVHSLAEEQLSGLISEYEQRLDKIEHSLNKKTREIEENREEILLTQEVHSLWLRADQEVSASNKIVIYDEILKLVTNDTEALTYKADAVLELGEPQWAVNLCNQALEVDPDNGHAFYQLACAYTALEHLGEALRCLREALIRSEVYKETLVNDPALDALKETEGFRRLLDDEASSAQ